MIPKQHRLSKNAEVAQTAAKGRSFFSHSFILKTLPNKDTEFARITIIASNKFSNKAVIRNRYKRIIKTALYPNLSHLQPLNYVFILRKSALFSKPGQITEELQKALQITKALKS